MLAIIKAVVAFVLVCAAGIFAARALFPLPTLRDQDASTALPFSPDTQLGRVVSDQGEHASEKSGVLPIRNGRDAIGSRLLLANMAEKSIDAQYYIWHDDTTGRLLLKSLYDAANRGVRVRLLLDDNGVPGLDPTIAALQALPNFEIRLFNPSTVRSPKIAGYLFDFFRMNRRMHNKAFIVDGAAAIIGGRNIGDEYFEIGDASFFIDLDVLAVGAIVPETARAFDLYWNSASAYPAETIIAPSTGALAAFLDGAAEATARPEAKILLDSLVTSESTETPGPQKTGAGRLTRGQVDLEWVDVRLVADDPAKGLGKATRDQLMISRLGSLLGDVKDRLDLVSAYFVPGAQGAEFFAGLARGGANVNILTNAMTTTDVAVVHAGYSKYRHELLDAGIKLYELKPVAGAPVGRDELSVTGSSGASLHAKTFAVDKARIFIGSFNFDPRSALLNCEMGFLIDSPALAQSVSDGFDTDIPTASYQPVLDGAGTMTWTETNESGTTVTYADEPGTTAFDRAAIVVLGWLPIEWLL